MNVKDMPCVTVEQVLRLREYAAQLEYDRDQLKTECWKEAYLAGMEHGHHLTVEGGYIPNDEEAAEDYVADKHAEEYRDAYNEKPTTSLARLRAEWQAEALEECFNDCCQLEASPAKIMRAHIDKRRQAKELS